MRLKKSAMKFFENKLFVPILLISILLLNVITIAVIISNNEDGNSLKGEIGNENIPEENNWFESLFSFLDNHDSENVNEEIRLNNSEEDKD